MRWSLKDRRGPKARPTGTDGSAAAKPVPRGVVAEHRPAGLFAGDLPAATKPLRDLVRAHAPRPDAPGISAPHHGEEQHRRTRRSDRGCAANVGVAARVRDAV